MKSTEIKKRMDLIDEYNLLDIDGIFSIKIRDTITFTMAYNVDIDKFLESRNIAYTSNLSYKNYYIAKIDGISIRIKRSQSTYNQI